jgi:O-antigen ligase/tetratricopeptide (TPR) repeat protein
LFAPFLFGIIGLSFNTQKIFNDSPKAMKIRQSLLFFLRVSPVRREFSDLRASVKRRGFSGRRVLDFLIESAYLAVIFFIPLWFAYFFPTYHIFEFNKMILFRILLSILGALTVIKIIFYPPRLRVSPREFFKKYWLIPIIFIVGLSLTLFISDDPLRSFYGSLERQAGLRNHFYYFLWFILVGFNVLTVNKREETGCKSDEEGLKVNKKSEKTVRKNIRRIIISAVLSGLVVSVYGILQFLNIDFLTWPEPPFLTKRIFSSLGQPNFLASWLLLVIPLSFYCLFNSRRSSGRIFFILVLLIQLSALFLTASRGGLLALFLAVFLFLLFFLFSWRSRRKKVIIILFFLGLAAIFLVALNHFLPNRVSSLLDFKSGSVAVRAGLYSAAADAISRRPIFGYGLESGTEVFIRYYEPDWAIAGDVGQSADRAHNLVLDILINAGFYGLILFLLLYYFIFSLIRDNLKIKTGDNLGINQNFEINQAGQRDKILSLALAFGLLAYLLSLLFSFAIVAGEIYFWLFIALLVVINFLTRIENEIEGGFLFNQPVENQTDKASWKGMIIKIIAVVVIIIAAAIPVKRAFKELIADYYLNEIYFNSAAKAEENNHFFALILVNNLRELKINPFNQVIYDISLANRLSELYPATSNIILKNKIRLELENLRELMPEQGYRNLLAKARINIALSDFSAANKYIEQIIEISPYWPIVYLEAGKSAAAAGEPGKALAAYNLLLLNLPEIEEYPFDDSHQSLAKQYYYLAYYKMAKLFDSLGDWPAAEKYYRLAYSHNPFDFTVLKNIADTYYRRGDLATAINYNLHGLTRNPEDYNWLVALAALYYESGDLKNAGEYLDQALELAPDKRVIKELEKEYGLGEVEGLEEIERSDEWLLNY